VRNNTIAAAGCLLLGSAAAWSQPTGGENSQTILTVDHYVPNRSTVPAIAGQTVQLYVRERVKPATVQRGAPGDDRVVLFVHGAGTPAEVAFDVPYADYSWMAYLAAAGFDVFSMDMTGYGRSTRPNLMNDVCNLSADQQRALGRMPCDATHEAQLTTIASDWHDIDAVVEYLRVLRDVPRVSLIGWSQGGPRAGGYAARNPDKVSKLVLLAPAYRRDSGQQPPQPSPAAGVAFNAQSHADFTANWERQLGCPLGEADVLLAQTTQGPDFAEGVAAFTGRRAPDFAPLGQGTVVSFP
jgi:pimeloyl-ACP methyl ester carboxylesterase